MLRSGLCDFSDVCIVVKGAITVKKTNRRSFIDIRNRSLAFKNNAPFPNCISKIINVSIESPENLDVVMPMYKLLEYSKSYSKATESLWNYYRDEPNNPPLNDGNPPTVNYNADPITNSTSFKYKASIKEKHRMQIKKTVKTLSKKIHTLRKILQLLFH